MANLQDIEQSIDLYMVEETDAWHSKNTATPVGLYHSKEEAIVAILNNHNIDKGELIEELGYGQDQVLGKNDEYPAEPEEPVVLSAFGFWLLAVIMNYELCIENLTTDHYPLNCCNV